MSNLGGELAERLADTIGEITALQLMKEFGGTTVFIPKKPDGSKLAAAIGVDATKRLEVEFGSGHLVLPMSIARGQAARRERAMMMLRGGASISKTARACDLCQRSVERYSARLRDERQTEMRF